MGAAAMLLGGGKVDKVDEPSCLALIRPVYSGGTWVLVDASPSARAVTNYGVGMGADGTDPWGGTSGLLIDSVAANRCFVVGGAAFGAVKSGACWFYPTSVGDSTKHKTFFKIGRNTAARPDIGIGYLPAPEPNAIRLFVYCAESSSIDPYVIAISTTIYPLRKWIFCGIKLPTTTPGPIELWADGAQIATTANTTPALGQSDAMFGVGAYWNDNVYGAVGRYAEAGIWSAARDLSVVPTGPYEV